LRVRLGMRNSRSLRRFLLGPPGARLARLSPLELLTVRGRVGAGEHLPIGTNRLTEGRKGEQLNETKEFKQKLAKVTKLRCVTPQKTLLMILSRA
jgi:hypothetical protein